MQDDERRPWYAHPAVWVVAAALLIVVAIAAYLAVAWHRHARTYRAAAAEGKTRDAFAQLVRKHGMEALPELPFFLDEPSFPLEGEYVSGLGTKYLIYAPE